MKRLRKEGEEKDLSLTTRRTEDYSPTISRNVLLQTLYTVCPNAVIFSVVAGFFFNEPTPTYKYLTFFIFSQHCLF